MVAIYWLINVHFYKNKYSTLPELTRNFPSTLLDLIFYKESKHVATTHAYYIIRHRASWIQENTHSISKRHLWHKTTVPFYQTQTHVTQHQPFRSIINMHMWHNINCSVYYKQTPVTRKHVFVLWWIDTAYTISTLPFYISNKRYSYIISTGFSINHRQLLQYINWSVLW